VEESFGNIRFPEFEASTVAHADLRLIDIIVALSERNEIKRKKEQIYENRLKQDFCEIKNSVRKTNLGREQVQMTNALFP
jgi:hypothetical protein